MATMWAIPVSIHPLFWLFAALIGWLNTQNPIGTLVWVGIIFGSVLFHEFGHALCALCFRQKVHIQLVPLGGVTSYKGKSLRFWQQFFIVLSGPVAGIILCLFAGFLTRFSWPLSVLQILRVVEIANLFWSFVNLLPVLPLDGGQLLRIALESLFGIRGFRASLFIGTLVALSLSFYFFLVAQAFLIGALFFLLAFQSLDLWRKSRWTTSSDRQEDIRQLFSNGESLFQKGNRQAARQLFEQVLSRAPGGTLAASACQYLAFLAMESGEKGEAFRLLEKIRSYLTSQSRYLLHELAEERGRAEIVAELSAEVYESHPTTEVALRNARAFAALNQPKPAGGWLSTACHQGDLDVSVVVGQEAFNSVRAHPDFCQFLDQIRKS